MPIQLSFNDSDNKGLVDEYHNIFDKNKNLDIDINNKNLGNIIKNDTKFINDTLHDTNKEYLLLLIKEIAF